MTQLNNVTFASLELTISDNQNEYKSKYKKVSVLPIRVVTFRA